MSDARWAEASVPENTPDLDREDWPKWLAPILARRGLGTRAEAEAFLAPSLDQLHDPLQLPDMPQAVARLAQGAGNGEKVAIVGDYDVDGVSAAALLTAVFRACGLGVETILPHRLVDGYGFQVQHVDRAKAAGATTVVTADCGSTSYEAIEAARGAGLEVIVTDHHVPGRDLAPGTLHVNPKRPDSTYPFNELCGAGIAFKLCQALTTAVERPIDVTKLLRIACLGTIADVVPLLGENRVIAALGLQALGSMHSPGLRALARISRTAAPFAASDVGFRIGPRINAAGRMDSPDAALELLLTTDPQRAEELAEHLDKLNRDRRQSELRAVEQAREAVLAHPELPPILVESSPEWHRGVVGIAAGRLAREFHRPTILLAEDGATATGSGRSVRGIDLQRFIAGWTDELEKFGGHAQAIGMTVDLGQLPSLTERWQESARDDWDPALLSPRYRYDAHLSASDVGHELLRTLDRLEPCGASNPQPLFRLGPVERAKTPRLFGEGHVSMRVRDQGSGAFDIVAWRWAERVAELPELFEVLGRFELDSYTGQPVLSLVDARGVASYS